MKAHPNLHLTGFENLVGHHCSSSAVRSVLAFDGLELAESLVFGLGSGLGFFYSIEPGGSPTRRFNGRAPDLEGNFYALAGAPVPWAESWRPELIAKALAAGRPLIAQTDIFPIPYYDNAHFIGHGLAVIGMGPEGLVTADIAAEDMSRMSLDDFREAVARSHYPLQAPYRYAPAPRLDWVDVADMAPKAVAKTVAYMLEPPTEMEGVAGIRAMAEDFPNWLDLPDLPWAARFGYQAIEKRGTGGGNFRLLYRDFLLEVQPHLGTGDEVVQGFAHAAARWSELAQTMKTLAFCGERRERVTLLQQAQAQTRALAGLEQDLFERLGAGIAGDTSP